MQDTVAETVSYLDEDGHVIEGPVDESEVQVVIHQYVDEDGNPMSPPQGEISTTKASLSPEHASERSFTIAPIPDSALIDDGSAAGSLCASPRPTSAASSPASVGPSTSAGGGVSPSTAPANVTAASAAALRLASTESKTMLPPSQTSDLKQQEQQQHHKALKDSGRSVLAKALDAAKGKTDMTASEVDLEISVEEGDSDDDSDAFVE